MLLLQPLEPGELIRSPELRLRTLRERQAIGEVPFPEACRLPGLQQSVPRVLAHRLGQSVARFPVVLLRQYQRLIDETGQEVERVILVHAVPGADRLGRLQGPATREDREPAQQDLLRFAGVRVGDLRPGLEQLELRTFRDERGRELLDLPRAPLPDSDTPAPIRFLPKWDSSLLAYAPPERTRILPEKFRSTVIRKNGDVLPTVLVDGFVAATWNVDKKRGLEIEPLRRLTKAEHTEIDEAGEPLVEFVRS